MVALCAWFQGGAYLDAWAHGHVPELETFFSPWHGVLYSGFAAVAACLLWKFFRPGGLPDGYRLSLVGAAFFALGGVLDGVWHTIFGVEVDVEALLSPSHLVLAVSSTLILTGPLRAAWRRPTPPGLPVAASMGFLLASFTFWTLYAHPIARPWAGAGNQPAFLTFAVLNPDPFMRGAGLTSLFVAHGLGMASILLQAAVTAGVVLLVVWRWGWALPLGTLTVAFTINAVLIGAARDQLILLPAAVLAGVAADGLLRLLRPSSERECAFRAFAVLVPAIYYVSYFGVLKMAKGVWWSIPLWTGAIVLAGIVGLLVSYLIAPPEYMGGLDAPPKPPDAR
jgi:hypothetical protein